jgi:four helix bundle protein
MATIGRFEDLQMWQKARILCQMIHPVVTNRDFRNFTLRDQIQASSGSVMDNIAEGFGRENKNEFLTFLGFSKGSLNEVKSQLYRLLDTQVISQEVFDQIYEMADEISKMISSFINYLNKSDIRGLRYKKGP